MATIVIIGLVIFIAGAAVGAVLLVSWASSARSGIFR